MTIDLTPHTLSVDEQINARLAWSHVLTEAPSRAAELLDQLLRDLPPESLAEIAHAAEFLHHVANGLRVRSSQDVVNEDAQAHLAAAILTPDVEPIPDGVQGQKIGGRS